MGTIIKSTPTPRNASEFNCLDDISWVLRRRRSPVLARVYAAYGPSAHDPMFV
jgi:hypothetical protein